MPKAQIKKKERKKKNGKPKIAVVCMVYILPTI